MDLRGWNDRYRLRERTAEDFEAAPTPLVAETAKSLPPGKALDLACGTGRNALWLVERGWRVTAVDGAASAVEEVRRRAHERGLAVDARIANLEKGEYRIDPETWDLILMCYYLQTNLFHAVKEGVVRGGIALVIVHCAEPGEKPGAFSLRAGDLPNYFGRWEILHSYEGPPEDRAHRRRVSEIVARRPLGESDH